MLKTLFRPKWQHQNPEIRKSAIAKMDNTETAIFETLAVSDQNAEVRNAAIARIDDIKIIEQLVDGKKFHDENFALKCWVNVLTESGKYSLLEQERIITECIEEKYLGSLFTYSNNDNIRTLALAGISSDTVILSLMEKNRNGRSWQMMVGKLSSEDALKKANAIINGKDKKSQQLIKAKLDEVRKNHQTAREKATQAQQLVYRLEHLLASDSNPLFEGILLSSKQLFKTLESELPDDTRTSIENLISRCEERLGSEMEKQAAILLAEESQQHVLAKQATLLNEIDALIEESENLGANSGCIEEMLSHIVRQWPEESSPSGNTARFHKLSARIAKTIKTNERINEKGLSELSRPDVLSALGYMATEHAIKDVKFIQRDIQEIGTTHKLNRFLESLLERLDHHKKYLEQTSKQLHQEIDNGLPELEKALDNKDLNASKKLHHSIKTAIEKLPEHDGQKYINEFQRMSHALRDLEDWKAYAGDEKRLQLCDKMQALIDSSLDIQHRANTIKALQDDWKKLGHCHDQKLWNTFRKLSDEAYAPCQKHFQQLRAIRKFNAEQCIIICEQLEKLLETHDWSSTDWKHMDNLYKAFHEEWKRFSSLEREAYKTLQDRFHHNTRQLKARLDEERNRNHEKLSQLVEKAHALLENADTNQAIDEYSKLQIQWKNTGITFHKQQHEQWQAFRKAGDNLYQKRQNQRHEADHARQDNLQLARKVINEITNLAALEDSELANSKARFESLKSEFKSLGSLPKDDFKSCMNAFELSCNSYEDRFSTIEKRQWARQLTALASFGQQWRQAENSGADPDFSIANKILPDAWLKRLRERIDHKANLPQPETARLICIEMELLAGVEVPAEDAALKMQWQMTNLARNFGHQQVISQSGKMEDLYLRWYSQRCWNNDDYTQLEQRFLKASRNLLEQ